MCEYGCGAPNGHCKLPGVCECVPGWVSTDLENECDRLDYRMHDANCIVGSNEGKCSECKPEYFLDTNDLTCGKCSEWYDPSCIRCSKYTCTECQWPYDVDASNNYTCHSRGVFEFTRDKYNVRESEHTIWVWVRRAYG